MPIHVDASVYYHSDYGTAPDDITVDQGSTLTASHLPTLTESGYIHVGWYSTSTFDEGTEIVAGYVISNHTDLYAKWVDEVVVSVSSLQGIGNAIRAKNGTATQYKPGEMGAAIEAISEDLSAELTEYSSLNSELESVIDSLPSAGGGGSGGSVETCTVTISGEVSSRYPVNIAYTTVSSDGKVVGASQTCSTSSATVTCVKGTIVTVLYKSNLNITTSPTNASVLFSNVTMGVYKLTDGADTAYIFNDYNNSGGSIL